MILNTSRMYSPFNNELQFTQRKKGLLRMPRICFTGCKHMPYKPNQLPQETQEIIWADLIDEALTAPGRRGETYIRGHDYSYLNNLRLFLQGVREPTTSFNGWKKLGRHVTKGSKGYSILRPIMVKTRDLDELGQPKMITKFKLVNGAFKYSQTEGEPLPDELTEPPEWSVQRAMGTLGISMVKFADLSLNKQGYSYARNVAINPTAVYPLKTTWHEMGHIEAGHTAPDVIDQYELHRGLCEFEAEGTAYLGMHELGLDEQMNAAESRSYIQNWLGRDTPPDSSIRKVFKLTDVILKAGSQQPEELEATA